MSFEMTSSFIPYANKSPCVAPGNLESNGEGASCRQEGLMEIKGQRAGSHGMPARRERMLSPRHLPHAR